ncbi:MAG TPA: hypothetical protein VHF58_05690, partial [Solirubrobacterales bacterium]|nr:hypothetical protein [Solirubrobacterales bacterium]
ADALPVRVECAAERAPCELVAEQLSDEGVQASIARLGAGSGDALRVLVGTWPALRDDPLAGQLGREPATSGVFALMRDTAAGGELVALDERAEEVDAFGGGAGLVAGLRRGEDEPAFVVTGTDSEGLDQAIGLLDEGSLANRYAVAIADGVEVPLPARSEG